MSWVRILSVGLAGVALALAGCGDGDQATRQTGTLYVTHGGSGQIYLPGSQDTYDFADSITVAVQTANDEPDEFTIYTLFGLSRLDFDAVPSAALVTFVSGLLPSESYSTEVPSSVVGMVFHEGYDRSVRATLAQSATGLYERATSGSFILEPQTGGAGFVSHDSADRQARYETVTLVDRTTADTALIDGAAPYQLSENINQRFFGYTGNFGLNTPPTDQGGGPPPPPGGGSGGSGGGGDDGPPSPPL